MAVIASFAKRCFTLRAQCEGRVVVQQQPAVCVQQVASHSTRALVQTLRGTQVIESVDCGVLGNEFLVDDSSNVEDNDQRRPEARFLESNLVLPG
jgi:hypothetical protein